MADTVNASERSRIMAAVKSKNTAPELVVRRLIHRLGYRYRLHVSTLPGTPDIVLPRLRKVIEVRGCFWHGHHCGRCRVPQTRRDYWLAKIERNRMRGRRMLSGLRKLGWSTLVVWECQTKHPERLAETLLAFLSENRSVPKAPAAGRLLANR